AATVSTQLTCLLQIGDRGGVGRVSVHVDHARPRPPAGQRKPQKQLGCHKVAIGRQHELDGLAGRIDRANLPRDPGERPRAVQVGDSVLSLFSSEWIRSGLRALSKIYPYAADSRKAES